MAVEIELKAWVDNPEDIKHRLSGWGTFCCHYEKADVYWTLETENPLTLRVRRESRKAPDGVTVESVLVTSKTREIHGGIEVNDEREFNVSDGILFQEILDRLGMRPGIRKEKRGWAWKSDQGEGLPPVLAELSEVKRLGWFIELEIISDSRSEQSLRENRRRLFDLLEKLGIPPEKTEPRAYSEMLRALEE